MTRALAGGKDFLTRCRLAAARGREHTLTLDLDHAGAAVPIGAHAFGITEVRDADAATLRGLQDGLAFTRADLDTIEGEANGFLGLAGRRDHASSSRGKNCVTQRTGLGAA